MIRLAPLYISLVLVASGCPASEPDQEPPTPAPTEPQPCDIAEQRLGQRVCAHSIEDWKSWQQLALPSSAHDQIAFTKYLSPVRDDARLPALFMNVNIYSLHYDLLVQAFPEEFPLLSHGEYNDVILSSQREFTAGTLVQFTKEGEPQFGFTVVDDPADTEATVTYEQALTTWENLSAQLHLGELAFLPKTNNQAAAAATWGAPFLIAGTDNSIEYEVYTRAVGYGTMRIYDLEGLETATEEVAFGFEDILVLDEAPADIEQVISGAVTGTRQGELSHLNVRSAARGTPNCFIPLPAQALAQWENQLVRMECGADQLTIEETTLAEAEAFWEQLRPAPLQIPGAEFAWTEMEGLLEVPTADAAQRATALTRYGSKGANLAALYQRTDVSIQLRGFVVPFHYYDAFMTTGSWNVDLGSGEAQHSFADTISYWLTDQTFAADGLVRRQRLETLRDAIRSSSVDPALIDALDIRIRAVFGDELQMVRFRSSSNAEDALEFSGAGIYDSTSACLADERDSDDEGPSLCDPDQDSERALTRALLKVWASLWNIEAFEERSWYGIDHSGAAMGVLVNDRSKNEQANFVAFTANPTSPGDERMLVNAQMGELDVVSAGPGVIPEKVLLQVDDAVVTDILRVSQSSVVLPGVQVLSDSQLRELGGHLWTIREDLPSDAEPPEGRDLLLDTEWKVLEDGTMTIKQVRPFLR
jgi:hypothetical protein